MCSVYCSFHAKRNLFSHKSLRELGWRSGESTRVPPMCPGFNYRNLHHNVMWVEFVVGSRPCSEGFSPGFPVFLPPQKSTFLNSNSIGNSRATGLSVEDCYVLPSLNKVNLLLFFFYMRTCFKTEAQSNLEMAYLQFISICNNNL